MTTASVPWLTGTAINALMRAGHLERAGLNVTLLIPWVKPEEQFRLWPVPFESKEQQAQYVLGWLRQNNLPEVTIRFYDAVYHTDHHSLYPMGPTLETYTADLLILEEPEHLNWYSYRDHRSAWRGRFPLVVGIVHTNYAEYAAREPSFPGLLGVLTLPLFGLVKSQATLLMARWMCNAHCHKVIKLSKTIPKLTKSETVCNVHGVRTTFQAPLAKRRDVTHGSYFIGKLVWQKLHRLVPLLHAIHKNLRVDDFHIIGDGPDKKSIQSKFKKLNVDFKGRLDHSVATDYRVLINPSVTEVLCTTVAEALAMGKWVIIARHKSNEFFYQFPTCLPFHSEHEFLRAYSYAMRHEPPPLPAHLRRLLTWEAATDRFFDQIKSPSSISWDQRLAAFLHTRLGTGLLGDIIRTVAGAGPKVGFQSRYTSS